VDSQTKNHIIAYAILKNLLGNPKEVFKVFWWDSELVSESGPIRF
jgi:hypothetical protein